MKVKLKLAQVCDQLTCFQPLLSANRACNSCLKNSAVCLATAAAAAEPVAKPVVAAAAAAAAAVVAVVAVAAATVTLVEVDVTVFTRYVSVFTYKFLHPV